MKTKIGRLTSIGGSLLLAGGLLFAANLGASPALAAPDIQWSDNKESECRLLGGEVEWVWDIIDGQTVFSGFKCVFADGTTWHCSAITKTCIYVKPIGGAGSVATGEDDKDAGRSGALVAGAYKDNAVQVGGFAGQGAQAETTEIGVSEAAPQTVAGPGPERPRPPQPDMTLDGESPQVCSHFAGGLHCIDVPDPEPDPPACQPIYMCRDGMDVYPGDRVLETDPDAQPGEGEPADNPTPEPGEGEQGNNPGAGDGGDAGNGQDGSNGGDTNTDGGQGGSNGGDTNTGRGQGGSNGGDTNTGRGQGGSNGGDTNTGGDQGGNNGGDTRIGGGTNPGEVASENTGEQQAGQEEASALTADDAGDSDGLGLFEFTLIGLALTVPASAAAFLVGRRYTTAR